MRIFVTGASGFLGSHLCRRLLAEGYQVTAFHRPASDLSALQDLNVNHAIGDITDSETLIRAMRGHERVVHAAANLSDWEQQRSVQEKINVEGTKNVVAACKVNGVARLLHVSSVAAIGLPSGPDCPADERFPFNLEHTRLIYHISKRRAEQVVWQAIAHGLDAVIVNPSSLTGSYRNRFRGREVADKVRRNKIVTHFSGGRNTVHVCDVADGIVRALEHGQIGERYILGGENLTWRRMAETAAELLGVRRIFVPVPYVATALAATLLAAAAKFTRQRPRITYTMHYCANRFQYYDSNKARQAFGYNPRSYEQIMREYLERKR